MSQQQLNRLIQDRDKLQKDLEKSGAIIKASVACEGLMSYVKSKQNDEPFLPEFPGVNPWLADPIKNPSGCPQCSIM
ncbi:hypothetical protein Pelo_15932 [Pelomyxa schiedti]|nr:hypothetical protein Pelo_15932 [Pelomyxa schiedti]